MLGNIIANKSCTVKKVERGYGMDKKNLKEEENCRKIFNDYYSTKGIKIYRWENMSEKNQDPPDYYGYISNVKYAVEITQMVVKKRTILSDGSVLSNTYNNSCIKLIREVEKKALEENKLRGLYIVRFYNPIDIGDDYKKVKKDLIIKLVNLIKETETTLSSWEEDIWIKSRKVCSISKIQNTDNQSKVEYVCIGGFGWTHSSKMIEQLAKLIQQAIDIKEEKLKKINEPKILIIRDTFMLADDFTYQKATSLIDNKVFESVFIISSNDCVLYNSCNKRWLSR